MIPTSLINDNHFLRSRELDLPVYAIDERTFAMPSATRPELKEHHVVKFDSASNPHFFSCACEAYSQGMACWAAARALDVLILLTINRIRVRPALPVQAVTREPPRLAKPVKMSLEDVPDAHAAPASVRSAQGERVRGFQI